MADICAVELKSKSSYYISPKNSGRRTWMVINKNKHDICILYKIVSNPQFRKNWTDPSIQKIYNYLSNCIYSFYNYEIIIYTSKDYFSK